MPEAFDRWLAPIMFRPFASISPGGPLPRPEVPMSSERPGEEWSRGNAYEAYVGRWSRAVAGHFLSWLKPEPGLRWLDVGCGTGALTAAILGDAAPAGVLGVDSSAAYVEDARHRVGDTRAHFEVTDASELAMGAQFDVAVSGLVLNFLPDPEAAVRAMARAVVPGGVVASYVWDYGGLTELIRYFWDAAGELDESARELDEGVRFPLCHPGRLGGLWWRAGLGSIETTAIDVPSHFPNFDDYWSPFLGGQGPAPGYVKSRSQPQREALREAVRTSLPIAEDGSISLVARAWAVRGRMSTSERD